MEFLQHTGEQWQDMRCTKIHLRIHLKMQSSTLHNKMNGANQHKEISGMR